MDGATTGVQGRFFDRFREARVAVANARDVFRRTLKFHDVDHFLDQIAGLWANNVATKHSVIALS